MTQTETLAAMKEAVRARDGYKCVDCGLSQEEWVAMHATSVRCQHIKRLDVHRKIQDGPYSLENCETLCRSCHCKRRRDYTGEWLPWWKMKTHDGKPIRNYYWTANESNGKKEKQPA